MEKVKVNVTLDANLLARADEFADDNYLTRSGLLSLALTQYLNQNSVTKALTDLAVSMRRIADNNNNISDEDMRTLKEFEQIANLIAGK